MFFKVKIPASALSGSDPVTLCIQASLKGEYDFPKHYNLFSGVYCVSLHPAMKSFSKNVTIALQHCATKDDGNVALSFYTAKETPPYIFEPMPGGSFSEPGQATIDVTHFCWFAVLGFGGKNYSICTYYLPRELNIHEAHITVTQNKELLIEVLCTLDLN